MKILVYSNDVVPGLGVPVAAPGLRSWGLAIGLRTHHHEVVLAIDDRVLPRAWRRAVPPPLPRGVVAISPQDITPYVRVHGFDAVIITNSNVAEHIDEGLSAILVYDFFAPKMLEFAERARSLPDKVAERQIQGLRNRKLNGLRKADCVISNGAKKVPYIREWLALAGCSETPVDVVNMALPIDARDAQREGPVRVAVTGYLQPWSTPGRWTGPIASYLDSGSIELHLMVSQHWGGNDIMELPPVLEKLAHHENTVVHGPMSYSAFRSTLRKCDLALDVFSYNPERELAMVTRSVVALACGLPVMHVAFTEVTPMIEAHGAGWIVDGDSVEEIASTLARIVPRGRELENARQGALRLAETMIDPNIAVAKLSNRLEDLQ